MSTSRSSMDLRPCFRNRFACQTLYRPGQLLVGAAQRDQLRDAPTQDPFWLNIRGSRPDARK